MQREGDEVNPPLLCYVTDVLAAVLPRVNAILTLDVSCNKREGKPPSDHSCVCFPSLLTGAGSCIFVSHSFFVTIGRLLTDAVGFVGSVVVDLT